MIAYDIDPSLHPAQPEPVKLDDGFTPPPRENEAVAGPTELGEKSAF